MTRLSGMSIPMSPTARTSIKRGRERARTSRSDLTDVLSSARICHMGVTVDGVPSVVPTVFGVDFDGPDHGGTLYLHGSVAAQSLAAAAVASICVTVTIVDGPVLARSGFHHSMNFRSAMIFGQPRSVRDNEERRRALDAIVDQVIPGRSSVLRAHTKKELAATIVLVLRLYEASVKARSGGPADDPANVETNQVWAGVVPTGEWVGTPEHAEGLRADLGVPAHVGRLCQ